MRIGFIGAGAMAEALLKGFLDAALVSAADVCCSDISQVRLDHMRENYGVAGYQDNGKVVEESDVVIIALKPQVVRPAVEEINADLGKGKLLISIAAGISLGSIENWAGRDVAVIRIMPNTPCLIGKGISAVSRGSRATEADLALAIKLMQAVGSVVEVPEKLMHAATALSGSGPAYIYLVLEALVDAGVELGLPRDVANKLAAETAIGAAEMVSLTGEHPAVLKAKVMSPGGTTAAALREMEAGGLRSAFAKGLKAAYDKSVEIGKG